MRNQFLTKFAVLTLSCVLNACSAPPSPGNGTTDSQTAGGDAQKAKIPVLRSSYFEKNWGPAQTTTTEDGGYQMRFRQGTSLNYVIIIGLTNPKPEPAKAPDWSEENFTDQGEVKMIYHKQSWKQTSILGKNVKWYQKDNGGGADFPLYQTVDFSLTAPDGRVGRYRIAVCSSSEKNAADWINKVNW